MIGDTVISVKGLSKCYHIYERPRDRLIQNLWRGRKRLYKEFWALRDVSFEVRRGAALGIIGRNGSGKSTLLQILTGIMVPTAGVVEVNGRVAALLELGSGFNPEFSGRENVYINCAILGVDREQIDAHWDEIVAFAEIGDFIDQPVKEYSSGMMLRLAFSVQTAFAPEILIVDEALSVGDFFFQQKCLRRIHQLREMGTTILFVSHDMATVRDLCDTAVYLRSGHMAFQGPSHTAIHHYLLEGAEHSQTTPSMPILGGILPNMGFVEEFNQSACWVNNREILGGLKAKLIAVAVLDQHGMSTMQVDMGSDIVFRVLYQIFTEEPVHVTLMLKNRQGQMVSSTGTYALGTKLLSLKKGDYAILELRLSCMLEAGLYTFAVSLGLPLGEPNRGEIIGESPWLGPLKIEWDYENNKASFLGMFGLPCSAQFVVPSNAHTGSLDS